MMSFLKQFANTQLGNPTMFAPKGPEGWQTAVQAEGSPMATTPEGAFSGFNPKVSDVGRAMYAAGGAMPGGSPMSQTSQGGPEEPAPPMPTGARPSLSPTGAFAPGSAASWLKPFGGQ